MTAASSSAKTPVLEVVTFQIVIWQAEEFEKAIGSAFQYLTATPGYLSHELRVCLEDEYQYLLLIHWESLEAHLVNFRESENFQQWRNLISPFFASPPQVFHYSSPR